MKAYYYLLTLVCVVFVTACATEYMKIEQAISKSGADSNQRAFLINHLKSGRLSREDANNLWEISLLRNYHGPAVEEGINILSQYVGVNKKVPHMFNMTPLMLACSNQHNGANVFQLLINNGADVNAQLQHAPRNSFDSNTHVMKGSTALHFCAGEWARVATNGRDADKYMNQTGYKVLIDNGANPNVRNTEGRTPADSYSGAQQVAAARRNESSSGGIDMGQAIAIAGGAALTNSSSLNSAQKADFMTNYTADVLTNSGGSNTKTWGNQQTSQPQSQQFSNNSQNVTGLPGISSSYKLTCDSPATRMCGEYTFTSQDDRSSFVSQCKAGNGRVLSGGCPSAPSCSHKTGNRTVTTYVYSQPANIIKNDCMVNGGVYNK